MSRILPKRTSTLTACFLPFFGGEIIYLPKTCILAKAFGDPSYVAEWKIHELHWQQLLYCVFDLDWYFKHSIMVLRNCINSGRACSLKNSFLSLKERQFLQFSTCFSIKSRATFDSSFVSETCTALKLAPQVETSFVVNKSKLYSIICLRLNFLIQFCKNRIS